MSSGKVSYHERLYYLMKKAEKEKMNVASSPFSEPKKPVENKRSRFVAGLQLLRRLAGN